MRHPVRTAKRQLLRFGSCVLSALLALSPVPVSAVDNGVSPVYDEAYYAMTDYYGNLTEGSVVKSYLTNGYSTLTDYGQYDEVLNLTDGTVPSSAGGIAINTGAAIAREIADVTIASEDLFELVTLRKISQALMGRIQRNYRFIVGFNLMLIVLGVTGVIQPTTSALLHNASTLGISLDSMTDLLDKDKEKALPETESA